MPVVYGNRFDEFLRLGLGVTGSAWYGSTSGAQEVCTYEEEQSIPKPQNDA